MPSLLETDGYKFSMAEAGFPLRHETFYYTHRKGGWQYLPVDVEAFVQGLLPTPASSDYAYLDSHGYFQGGAFRQAITQTDRVKITGLPKWSWFYDREPVFSVTGPSAIPSWLEPLVLQLHFRIQVATCALLRPEELAMRVEHVTCDREKEIVLETLAAVGVKAPPITVDTDRYYQQVFTRAKRLVDIVENPDRLFEVGMRAVSCVEQHEIALRAVAEAGIRRTSNVALAEKLGLIPVGTMGHEHVQRHGSDYAAYTSMRDKFPGFIFYLPDTFDTLASGIPSALAAMLDDPKRNSGIRFDSEHGIVGHYLYAVNRAREIGLTPMLGLESGWDEAKTVEFEHLRKLVDWPADRQCYGYGGYLVKPPWLHFGRDDVSAVWKISQTGDRATMKFGDEPGSGKASIPGHPVVLRPRLGSANYTGPAGVLAQAGENIPGFDAVSPKTFSAKEITSFAASARVTKPVLSPETRALVDRCTAERAESITRATSLLHRRL